MSSDKPMTSDRITRGDYCEDELFALLDERDAARAELDDYRKAWSLLDEPGAELRHAHTAEEAARQFVAKIGAARAELAAARMALSPIGVTEGALPGLIEHLRAELAKMTAFADKECAARMDAQVELAKVTSERDAAVERAKTEIARKQWVTDRIEAELRRAGIELQWTDGGGAACPGGWHRNPYLSVGNIADLSRDLAAAQATAAQHEKALEATRAQLTAKQTAADTERHEARGIIDGLRARCAMLTEALRKIASGDYGIRKTADAALAAPDAGVAEWLEKRDEKLSQEWRATALGLLQGELDAKGALLDLREDLAAHDAQVEAKARDATFALILEEMRKQAADCERTNSTTTVAGVVEFLTSWRRVLAGKDGTT